MNENERIELQRQIDLLVDGELSAEQERHLLTRLDQEEAWRDCALTFVENQVWRRAVPQTVDSPPAAIPRAATTTPTAAPILHGARGWDGRLGQLAALAASVMIAFIGGQLAAPFMTTSESGGTSVVSPLSQNSPQENGLFVNYRSGDRVDRMPIAIDDSKPFDPAAPFPTSFGMSAAELQELSDAGRTYQQKQQWVPVTLKDGRQAVIPMQEVVVEPTPKHYFP
ncbi:hypothetical protein [Blastopirellula marina]|uniref:Anti sigma-E protein RseA N-terminal domain-containing protein n=1 Tax=Blastopirellula marina DSM 3645 TaxID=314230 RepID=A3ZWU2_9BACT|nr:hypothetical protein [Blastopirellula marina]EAQ79066.1 hypothetical protein DSM3645_13920 [Blastopirellula marina DSM 3645]